MTMQPQPLLSLAATARELECPVWLVGVLLARRVLHPIRVSGGTRISAREVDALVRAHNPKETTP